MIHYYLNRITGFASLIIISLHWASTVQAAPGNISNSPLFTKSNVRSNVFFEIDDSGSMDAEVLTKKYWDIRAYTWGNNWSGNEVTNSFFDAPNSNGSIASFDYLFNNQDDVYQGDNCTSQYGSFEECPAWLRNSFDWRIKSSSVNVIYYDPNTSYKPWQNGDGTVKSNAVFNNVRSDPQSGSLGFGRRRDLQGFVYHVWSDTHGFTGIRPTSGTVNRSVGANGGIVDWWDEHLRFTVKANSIDVDRITYNGNTENSASITTLTGTGVHTELGGRTIAQTQVNIANWYQYHRRRSFVTKAALGSVITNNSDFRYGLSVINQPNTLFIEVPATSVTNFTTHNTGLLNSFYSYLWPGASTPLRLGLENAGEYFSGNLSGKTNPIQYECQQNFTVLFTDGFWNGINDPNVADVDGDNRSATLADVARHYYINDLDSTLADNVPVNDFDTATYQHMVTLGIAFGVNGALSDNDNNGWPEDLNNTANNLPVNSNGWGDPSVADSPQKIDDLWHASYNSRGTFVSASTPKEVADSLDRAISSVGDRQGSSAAVSFDTSSLTSDTHLFYSQFNKNGNKWSGDLISYKLDPATGDIVDEANPVWNATKELDDPANSRTVITYDRTLVKNSNMGNGIPFQWTSLSTAVKNDFRTEPNGVLTTDDVKAEARLNYLRGDKSNEASLNGAYSFRNREHLLGDIIHSSPAFVKKPKETWPNETPFSSSSHSYSDFVASQSSRQGVVYVGSNDGMLHGFSETNGKELMAYIPSYLFSSTSATEGLHYLTDPNYQHRYYVDLSPSVSDVYIDNKWRSILLGGSRSGGRGIFALDVTTPSDFSETNADKMVLWEFSDVDDADDLGFNFSTPVIAMMNNNRWAAIFGNGYNSKDGKAKLFIVFLDGGLDGVWTLGTDYLKIDTGGSPVSGGCLSSGTACNGLSSPEAVDLDGDEKIDRIYAGDLKGNLWAFDVTDDSDTSKWDVAYKKSGTPAPLFVASSSQPITDKPVVVEHPDISSNASNTPNLLVFFGTGQYLSNSDVTTTPATQSFYGIWDHGVKEITPSVLFEHKFDTSTTFIDNNDCDSIASGICEDIENDLTKSIRVFEDNDYVIDYLDPDGDGYYHHGWKINFNVIAGERIIHDPLVYDSLVIFVTSIPDATPCKAGGDGYLMIVEQGNGSAPDINDPAFDLNGDGDVDGKDTVKDPNDPDDKRVPSGGKIDVRGMPGPPNILDGNLYIPGSNGEIAEIALRKNIASGRLSWQELR